MPALPKRCLTKPQGSAQKKILLLLLFVTTVMQGIYNYIPETTHVSRVYSVATVLYLQTVLHVMLSPMLKVLYYYYYRIFDR
jgi:hypothetical protein